MDKDGNFQLDDNETSFIPDNNGSFTFPAPPGQYSVCVLPNNADANITYPIEEKKAYLTWIDYESPTEPLLFGIQDNSQEQQQSSDNNQTEDNSEQNNPTPDPSNNPERSKETDPEQVNGLYERLLQEMESKSQNLDDNKQNIIGTSANGRDY